MLCYQTTQMRFLHFFFPIAPPYRPLSSATSKKMVTRHLLGDKGLMMVPSTLFGNRTTPSILSNKWLGMTVPSHP